MITPEMMIIGTTMRRQHPKSQEGGNTRRGDDRVDRREHRERQILAVGVVACARVFFF